jgi:SAM-dependent methyltransferase
MKQSEGIDLSAVQNVYSGPEGALWELVMGEQIHIGGFLSSMALAEKAGIAAGSHGIDLCCCNGAGMRFLIRFCKVASMHGVDATKTVVDQGLQRCADEGLSDHTAFTLADVTNSSLPDGEADFVWGEDAWCYVVDKPKLISEAARLVKPGGTIAFTDWLEGPTGLSDAEASRFLAFMKFPNIQDLGGYKQLLESSGCDVIIAEDTGVYAEHIDLYLDMLNKQLTYDALKIIGFDLEMLGAMGAEMAFMQELAHAGKIAQGRFVARKRT